jgi:5-methyltetrahydrofolate corrinoid/iron sulfur protein methyltransferase|uniref:Dihydropteroate synthase n=1 Tax=Desulfobacca acetoxidans TaxID=60893 RepID=A0A7C3WRC4_9BACT
MSEKFYRIGENLNVVTKVYGQAMKDRNPKPIQELVIKEAEKGVDYIDVNIGPARKGGEELMEWIVKIIQEVVPDIPLSLDTSNIAAMEAGLKVHKGRALINSIMARPERMDAMMPLVKKYDADMIGLLWGPEGMPRDEHERGMLTAEMLAKAAEYGIENERIWFDPIVAPLNIQQQQLIANLEYMKMLPDMAPGAKSTCGLSNASNGVPDHLRPIINRTYIIMLQRYGMMSAIVDAFDDELAEVVAGKRPDAVKVVYDIMDGNPVDIPSLPKDLQNYAKTARVIMGQVLFSDSWLEV